MPHRTPNQVPRDAELLLGQALVMEHEAVVFPVQQLDLVAPPVGEGLQPAVKGVVAELLLAQPRQPSEAFTQVDGVPVQIDVRHPYRRPEVTAHDFELQNYMNWFIFLVESTPSCSEYQFTSSISPGFQLLSNQGSSGPYKRSNTFQPFPGTV